MLFFYIRHGDPIYVPDSLTPLGERQADALAKRLSMYGVDKIYSSSSNRAILTSKPTCELVKKEAEIKDFANEKYAFEDFHIKRNGNSKWVFQDDEMRMLFADTSVISLGHNWFEHKDLTNYKKGVDRIAKVTYDFFKELGYEHIRGTGKYKVIEPNDDRVAFFAHAGFGLAFFSEILDIPYPVFVNHFDMCPTGMTVIEFKEENGFAIPKVLMLSSDSHLYREGLPLKYNDEIYF